MTFSKEWRKAHPEYFRKYNRTLNEKRRRLGLCRDCPNKSVKYWRCLVCREKSRIRYESNRSKALNNKATGANE